MSELELADVFDPRKLKKFYKDFKDRSPEVAKKISLERGIKIGHSIAQEAKIKGDDLNAIAAVFREFLRSEPTAKVETLGDRVRIRNRGFCPVMASSMSLNIPWQWLCERLGWPLFIGIARGINPHAEMTMMKYRHRGDPYCQHLFEIKR
ncbi:MAG: hypothetical protein ACE5OY_03820 [Candidatus Bathyarchaeia archaeon]